MAKEPFTVCLTTFALIFFVDIIRSNTFYWIWSIYTFPFRFLLYLVIPVTMSVLGGLKFLPQIYKPTPWLLVYTTTALLINTAICAILVRVPLILVSRTTLSDAQAVKQYRQAVGDYALPCLEYTRQMLANSLEYGLGPAPKFVEWLLSESMLEAVVNCCETASVWERSDRDLDQVALKSATTFPGSARCCSPYYSPRIMRETQLPIPIAFTASRDIKETSTPALKEEMFSFPKSRKRMAKVASL
uniref:ARAD1C43120p n=1 Tax=Blastobotrys adeninivorans TaxID=409370 RepID=A0A060T4R0_BLAAD